MTTLESAPPLGAAAAAGIDGLGAKAARGSVVSPAFDLAFFVLPPLGTLAFLAAQRAVPEAAFTLCALVWVGLAQSHFGATLLFFLDPRSVARYRRSPLVYFAVPLLLVVAATALGLTALASLALLAVPVVSRAGGASGPVAVQVPPKVAAMADAPKPGAGATKKSSIGKGKAAASTANAAGDDDSFWVEDIDIDGDGTTEQTDVLWDDEDKVLFLSASGDFKCQNGGTGSGDMLIAINGNRSSVVSTGG